MKPPRNPVTYSTPVVTCLLRLRKRYTLYPLYSLFRSPLLYATGGVAVYCENKSADVRLPGGATLTLRRRVAGFSIFGRAIMLVFVRSQHTK